MALPVQSELQSLGLLANDYEDVSVGDSAAVLDSVKVEASVFVVVIADGGNIRWTRNGSAPSTTYGLIVINNGALYLSPSEASRLQMIRTDTTKTVVAHVEYYIQEDAE